MRQMQDSTRIIVVGGEMKTRIPQRLILAEALCVWLLALRALHIIVLQHDHYVLTSNLGPGLRVISIGCLGE
jgi:hypothetical protein